MTLHVHYICSLNLVAEVYTVNYRVDTPSSRYDSRQVTGRWWCELVWQFPRYSYIPPPPYTRTKYCTLYILGLLLFHMVLVHILLEFPKGKIALYLKKTMQEEASFF